MDAEIGKGKVYVKSGGGTNDIHPYLGRIEQCWNNASIKKLVGTSPLIRRVHLPAVRRGLCYRFEIFPADKLAIELYCHTSKYPVLIDVFSGFNNLEIMGHIFNYTILSGKTGSCSARVRTIVTMTTDVADVVEIMKSLIEATKGKIIEACK
jgi:hypothetical protein